MRRMLLLLVLASCVILLAAAMVNAQAPGRLGQDAIWARQTGGATITLDGVLDEAVWAQAESLHIAYGKVNGLPGSGFTPEFQGDAISDTTNATVKFLAYQNKLYLAFVVPDSSVGGAAWPQWDGVLSSVKARTGDVLSSPREFFMTWLDTGDSLAAPPRFNGSFGGGWPTDRTPEQIAVWDAGWQVDGTANDDQADNGYVFEWCISLDSLNYDLTGPDGGVVEYNFSIWDGDFVFGADAQKISVQRTSWQNYWNDNGQNVGRIYVRPDVTVSSGAVPDVAPDVVLANGSNFSAPTIDGDLSDDVWADAYNFDIRWDDADLRATYPGIGPYRSGQFQPEINGAQATILDPGDATIMMFFRDDYLYLAADVRDQIVQGTNEFDRWDGVTFLVGDRATVDADNKMVVQELIARHDDTGSATFSNFLLDALDAGTAEAAIALKGTTTINDNTDVDEGYTVEIKINLTALGYPTGLGDHLLFMGVNLYDGDSFDDPANDYGSRTWWFRESPGGPALAWMVMDESLLVSVEDSSPVLVPDSIELLGNYPNPFNPGTTIRYSIPTAGDVSVLIYNVLGRKIEEVNAGRQTAGAQQLQFNAKNLSSGVYFYRVQVKEKAGKTVKSGAGKMILVK